MHMKINKSISLLFGIIIGLTCIIIRVPGWVYLIPWALSSILLGYFTGNKSASLINGFLFGCGLYICYNHHHIFRFNYYYFEIKNISFSYFNFLFSTLFFSTIGGIQGLIGSFCGFTIKTFQFKSAT